MALAAVLMTVSIFLPIWEKSMESQEAILSAIEITHTKAGAVIAEHSQTTVYLAIIAGLSAFLSIFSILSFKNRALQTRLNAITVLMISLFVVGAFYWSYEANSWFLPETYGDYGLGAYLPLVALLSTMLASRFIKKDEKLVRSMDRLR